jgi:hypothetical protein
MPGAPTLASWIRSRPVSVRVVRLAWLATIASVVGLSIALFVFSIRGIGLEDTEAYWSAALRLRHGQPLYEHFADPSLAQFYAITYRYSPWFAYAWVPLTYLPKIVAIVAWEVVLAAAGAWLVFGLLRRKAYLLAIFFGVLLFDTITEGNVQTLMVAWLTWGIERRSGPAWVALAATLKGFPILLALLYVRRREWRKAVVAVGLTVVVSSWAFLVNWRDYPLAVGHGLLWGTIAYWPVAVGAVIYAIRYASHRYQRLAAAATVLAVMPRFWLYDITILLVGLPAAPLSVTGASADASGDVRGP